MRLYGLLEKLTKVVLVNNQNIELTPNAQSGMSGKIIYIPDMASNTSQDMVLTLQQQELFNKTLTSPVVSGAPINPGSTKISLGSSANTLIFAGASGNSASISAANLAASKTFELPNNAAGGGVFVTTTSSGVVTSDMIVDGTIVNADISPTTSIDGSKIAAASGTVSGVVTTVAQTFAGVKTFSSAPVIADASGIAAASATAPGIVTTGAQTLAGTKTFSSNPTLSAMLTAGVVHNAAGGALSSSLIVDADITAGTITDAKLATISTAGKVSGTAITSGNINTSGSFTTSSNISVNGGSLSTSAATFNLVNATATTVNFAGAATAVSIGAATGTTTVNNSLVVTGDLTINGITTTVNTTNLLVEDKIITLNDGGAVSSGNGAGIEVEENALITGYVKVTSDRNGWEFKAPNSANVITIPNSLAAGDVVLTAGTQTIGGAKTLSSALTITPTSNQLVLGTTSTTTITAPTPAASRIYTLSDAGGNASFVMTAGAQTIGGAKTFLNDAIFSGDITVDGGDIVMSAVSNNIGSTSTSSNTLQINTGFTTSGQTKTVNIAPSGQSGSTTVINIGSGITGALNTVTFKGTNAITLPVGTSAQQPGQAGQPAAAQGMIRYNSTQNAFEGYDGSTWSGLGGGGTTDRISGSFAIGDVIYLNGVTPAKAQADTAAKAEVVGIVSKEITAGSLYEITLVGEISGLLAANFTENALPAAGETIFLSATVAGKMTITEPSVVGQISVPLGVASGSGTMYVAPKRGSVVGGANVRTQISLANAATTNVQNAGSYDAGSIEGWVYIDATTDYRFHVRANFARNGLANDYNLSYQTTGDTPPAGFSMGITNAGVITATLPSLAGFVLGGSYINFALNAPAVGATLPLQISGGLVTGPVLGAGTGAAVAAGYIGESVTSYQGTFQNLTNQVFFDLNSLVLPSDGVYSISALWTFNHNGATILAGDHTVGWCQTSGNSATGRKDGLTFTADVGRTGASDSVTVTLPPVIVRLSGSILTYSDNTTATLTNKTIYQKAYIGNVTAGTAQVRGSITAVRIA